MTVRPMSGMLYGTHARLAPEGCAVDPDLADPTSVLVGLFGNIAPPFVGRGALHFFLDHVALPPLSEALANLGFGHHHVYATAGCVAYT